MEIRRGDERDVAGIAAVHLATRRSAYRDIVAPSVLSAMNVESIARGWRERLRTTPQPHRLLVAGERTLRAFAHLGPAPDGSGELYAIHVHPDAQGTGLGRRLLGAAVSELEQLGHRRARLWVLEDNRAARGFYEHLGWRPTGGRRTDAIDAAVVTEVAYARDLAGG